MPNVTDTAKCGLLSAEQPQFCSWKLSLSLLLSLNPDQSREYLESSLLHKELLEPCTEDTGLDDNTMGASPQQAFVIASLVSSEQELLLLCYLTSGQIMSVASSTKKSLCAPPPRFRKLGILSYAVVCGLQNLHTGYLLKHIYRPEDIVSVIECLSITYYEVMGTLLNGRAST